MIQPERQVSGGGGGNAGAPAAEPRIPKYIFTHPRLPRESLVRDTGRVPSSLAWRQAPSAVVNSVASC